jgi:hypothetical protein
MHACEMPFGMHARTYLAAIEVVNGREIVKDICPGSLTSVMPPSVLQDAIDDAKM